MRRLLTRPARACRALLLVVLAALAVLVPATAQAHSLDSSTISLHVSSAADSATSTAGSVDATVSVPLATLDAATGSAYAGTTAEGATPAWTEAVTSYLGDHLAATGADGTTWDESWSDATVETIEGVESFTATVTFDTSGSSTEDFTLDYDALIEADPGHEAVVVLTDAADDVSTAGVFDEGTSTLEVLGADGTGETSTGTVAGISDGLVDMVGYGFHHVLEGADHLLFLLALLLPAPLVVRAGRWIRREGLRPALGRLVAVVTAFTVGHSTTLIAASLGWVSVPSTLVEVLVALSVGVAAVHAIRPLVRHGEELIAGAFGLVHGLAFAGILVDLGLSGQTSVFSLLAFNVGVELAGLAATLAVFPALYLASRTASYAWLRVGGAVLAILATAGWLVDRLGLFGNPLQGFEDATVGHLTWVALGLSALAVILWLADIQRRRPDDVDEAHDASGSQTVVLRREDGVDRRRQAAGRSS